MTIARPVELLAPAKDLTCGIEAVLHGADAIYIGAPQFSARAAAGNSIDDIRTLCDFAHLYNVRVYVALNTILTDDELTIAERMIRQIHEAGADALIIQDMGVMQLDIPPIPIHASTQTDNCTPSKVDFLVRTGFNRIILARELSLNEIQTIATYVPDASLEVFIHGSLCVSYSGRCYLSAAMNGRSANRGECAQCCRLPYSLVDADEKIIINRKHLLSLKDMNRSDDLEALMEAGVSSLKIEGRLKDVSYVKNITAHYRKRLDVIFSKNPAFFRPSSGRSTYSFEPQPEKSFNRRFTSYLLHGREMDMTSFDTPKSMGEPVGSFQFSVFSFQRENNAGSFQPENNAGSFQRENNLRSFQLTACADCKSVRLHNGDGLVFINSKGELEGFKVNRVDGNRIFPYQMPRIKPDTLLYRNYDHAFETLLSKPSAERKIGVTMEWGDEPAGFILTMTDEDDTSITIARPYTKEKARKQQHNIIHKQLSKLGDTPFTAMNVIISTSDDFFVPASLLNGMRREATEQLIKARRLNYKRISIDKKTYDTTIAYPSKTLDYAANVSNRKAVAFYKKHQAEVLEPAFEIQRKNHAPLMITKHCLRFSMGWCPVHHKKQSPFKEPYYLIYKDIRLRLSFDCKKCRMLIFISPENS